MNAVGAHRTAYGMADDQLNVRASPWSAQRGDVLLAQLDRSVWFDSRSSIARAPIFGPTPVAAISRLADARQVA